MRPPLLVALLIPLGIASYGHAQTCSNIRQFDFQNAAIPIASADEPGRSAPQQFLLRHGTGFLSDDPGSPQSRDWRLDLIVDRLVHPDASTWIRVIIVDKDRLTGTGDWRFIMAFGCRNHTLISVFQYSAEGVFLKHLSRQNMVLYQAVQTKEDAHCCPSRHMEIVYSWNPLRHRYRRASSVDASGFTAIPDEKRGDLFHPEL